ncbi:carbamoyltransferase C-terminal domain-containing protein [Arcobacter arenosus]|uniref:Carbamoyltransferase n=1 Tax=Arcobacter arenosus TaxID=2576037 RepID=A0A5R8Y1H0_9BACT|nr:carbamoyltransferase C-terminal domain-containing protein [Arcobacter arenosus]TLP38530.1 hypothetical protein FDK22_08705 [Arcobacter arenosus]
MKLYIGMKFFGHDTNVVVICPEKNYIFAISTERVTRYKHDTIYPIKILENIFEYTKLEKSLIKNIVFCLAEKDYAKKLNFSNWYEYETALREFYNLKYKGELVRKHNSFKLLSLDEQELIYNQSYAGKKLFEIKKSQQKNAVTISEEVSKYINKIFDLSLNEIEYFDHHKSHALGSFVLSPYEHAIAITFDGAGDGYFSKVFLCSKDKFEYKVGSKRKNFYLDDIDCGNSLGNIYEYFTLKLGFHRFSEEGKVEALAAYGNFDNEIFYKLKECLLFDRSNLTLDIDQKLLYKYFNKLAFDDYLIKFSKVDIAAAVQKFLEISIVNYISSIVKKYKIKNIVLSGGVFANVIVNMRIFEEVTNNIYIIPAMSDDGLGLGSICLKLLEETKLEENISWIRKYNTQYLGTSYSKEEIISVLKNTANIFYKDLGKDWMKKTAEYIHNDEVGAIFHGKMEWGPRALGNRSILGNPLNKNSINKLNVEVKNRPFYQPFCPSIMIDERERLFENSYINKDMTCAFIMKEEFIDKIPCAVHIDNTARVQFVTHESNPNYYKILSEFKNLTGYGVLLNTSFNKHGRTIIESPQDAIDDFLDTGLNFLMIEGIEVRKLKSEN